MIISFDQLKVIAGEKKFNIKMMEKDYLVTYLLFLLKDIKGIYFKGGTALNKIFLNHARLSEDLDYTITREIADVEKDIKDTLRETIFKEITHDKKVEGFTRLVVHYKLFHEEGTIFIDLNKRGKLLCAPEQHEIHHFCGEHIPSFNVQTLNAAELMAEKMAATIGRNRPRDHFDLYMILKNKYPLDVALVKQKCASSEVEFDILKMFNNAKKLKNRWDTELVQFLAAPISFQEVMTTLAKHFHLKDEKEKRKK